MRKTTLVAVISSTLLGAVAAQAEQWIDGGADADGDGHLSQAELSQVAPALSASFATMDVDSDKQLTHDEFTAWHESLKARMGADNQATPAAEPDADSTTGSNVAVGAARSNVDKKATSPTYHPYAAGTVGDDPAKPGSTSLPADARVKASEKDSGPIDQWMDGGADSDGDGFLSHAELTKLSPTLSDTFTAMDVDNDEKVSRGEFRSWHESLKARMVVDGKAGLRKLP